MSRMRSPITSRSNCAKESRIFECKPAHRGGRIERLRDTDEGDVVSVEHIDELREIHQRATEPVNLVDDDDIKALRLDLRQ